MFKSKIMDETLARSHLGKAEAQVAYEVQEIDKQRGLIRKLRNNGHETAKAEGVLKAMERSLDALKHHRDMLLERAGLYVTGEAGTNAGNKL